MENMKMQNMKMYKVQILYFNSNYNTRTIAKNLTLEEAQAICRNPETSSRTCKKYENRKRTETKGPWFYAYTEQ